ncbi:Adhesion G-protein coupled receptor F3 [Dissostichus eleginoides]|uniref:Adhesion G-protein coupled receptor F3 n=1 Tax=Dissostichus eleginoides TaxID=100907 RepID=A0AAD9C416_DISEL|nr:Adhesion G-protein coupled receptor F3 [Dissostichus eleginoides]
MWTITLLYILGLTLCQASGQGASTQMYYMRLTIESGAILNITEKLGEEFVEPMNLQVKKLQVKNLTMTTVCQSIAGGSECNCSSNFRWSEKGCVLPEKCTFPKGQTPMCVHNDAVAINGFLRLEGTTYHGCLKPEDSVEYKACHKLMFDKMKKVYSTLPGFDTLSITRYRVGSVIVEFALTVAQKIGQQDLVDKSDQLTGSVNASLDLESSGVIKLTMPDSPVCFSTKPLLSCKLQEPLNTLPVWQLSRDRRVTEIFNGTEAEVSTEPKETTVRLLKISELWEGVYSCAYHQKKNDLTISHQASALMDLALLPDILISTEPGFPKCDSPEEVLSVKVICEIGKNTENYTVTWAHEHLFNAVPSEETKKTFTAEAIVSCTKAGVPTVTCKFANRCNETRSATVDINIIYKGDEFCTAEGDWGDTKAGFTSRLKCKGATGHRTRKCTKGVPKTDWDHEVSACVNQDLNEVLKNAENSDIGLGSLDENAAGVFSQLDQVTNNSQKINSYANLNASVQTLRPFQVPLDVVPLDMGPLDMVPLDMVPLDMGPLDMVPLEMVPLDMVPLDSRLNMGPLDMVSLDMGPLDMGPLDMGPLDMVPLDMVPLDMVPLDMGPLDMGPLDMGPLDSRRKDLRARPGTCNETLRDTKGSEYFFHHGHHYVIMERKDFFDSSSNLLEESLKDSWTKTSDQENISLAERYLSSVEKLIVATNVTRLKKKRNIEVMATDCTKQNTECHQKVFNVSVILKSSDPGNVKTAGFKELEKYLPQKDKTLEPNSIVVSTTTERKTSSVEVEIRFSLLRRRPPHVLMKCVAWDNAKNDWSEDGCKWSGASDEGLCTCKHLSSFAILMQRYPLDIAGLDEVTQVGLSVSVVSLVICLIIEVLVWSSVVKTNTLYLRHMAHINISLCLLVADSCFLASMDPKSVSELWCRIFVVLKHFCFLSMFFWMLFLSSMLLHQAIFQFHHVSKTTYLRLSMFLGYVCPLLIVVITFLVYDGGIEGEYFSKESCWLLYEGLMKGSIHTFVIPVGIIVFVNVLSMMVVIMKLLDHPKNAERANESEKKAAVAVMRSVILLTPIFGVTWVFGFAGLFILLTTCVMDKSIREALGKRLKKNASAPTSSSSTTKLESTWKK